MPKAVHLSNYGIFKLPIMVPTSSALPNLILTLRDGNGNETTSTPFEISVTKKDGNFYTYSYNFTGQWSLNSPPVNDNAIKSIRIYIPSGQGTFQLGALELYNSVTIPESPINLSASITDKGEIALNWEDGTNATSYNLYRSDNPTDPFIKIKSNIKTSEVPHIIKPTAAINYYKITGVNAVGESALSTEVEVVAEITGTESGGKSPISVYPNPCNGRFYVQTNGEGIKQVRIFDARGIESPFDLVEDNNLMIVDLKSYKAGSYFLIINQYSKTLIVKVIIR